MNTTSSRETGFRLQSRNLPSTRIGLPVGKTCRSPLIRPLSSPPALALLLACCTAMGAVDKWRVEDPSLANALLKQGGNLVADYGGFRIIETDRVPVRTAAVTSVQSARDCDYIRLTAGALHTRAPEVMALRRTMSSFDGRRLHLVQFPGPIKPEWLDSLRQTGVRVVSYLPHNSYLLYGDSAALARLRSRTSGRGEAQWDGPYLPGFKVHPRARPAGASGRSQRAGTHNFAIQLVMDDDANDATLRWIDQWKLAPIRREFSLLGYRNILVSLPPERLDDLAAQPDVIAIQPYFEPRKDDERQSQIAAGNLAGSQPAGPGYLAWLAGKGFTQAQFDASAFVVDVSDSGIDNGTLSPGHFALYPLGDTSQGSRVAYSRLVGKANPGSTLAGCDGHGTLNAHLVAGYSSLAGSPHIDAAGFSYGLGVCPFVRVGASVIFDPDYFTSPDFVALQTQAYDRNARISNNSWGSSNDALYDMDSQTYDELVRNAGGSGGQRQMVIVFVAGNSGPAARTIDSPGTAKNVITVGATENSRSLSPADGGRDPLGSDDCGTLDSDADSAEDILYFSSHGPCSDGRMKPDLVAPGSHIAGGVPQAGTATTNGTGSAASCFNASSVCALPGSGSVGDPDNFFPLGQEFYTVSSGTSHAAPVVSGACALLRQHFINGSLPPPSPAMTKAFLMNSARYLTGAYANDTLWSASQGMGAVNLGVALDGLPRVQRDQLPEDRVTASGQVRSLTGYVADPTRPFRVTVAWTDAPASLAAGQALVNDLDLTVTVGGTTYRGNVFSGGHSTSGGTFDSLNNVESVFLPAGVSNNFTVTITAANIAENALTNNTSAPLQDYALVIYNATEAALPACVISQYELLTEDCPPANAAVDPGETVTIGLALQNIGNADSTNLVATLLEAGGVAAPGGSQSYGSLAAGGAAATRTFTFTTAGSCGDLINATFHLQDGPLDLGTVVCVIPLGTLSPLLLQNFDGGSSSALPAGWTSTRSGAQKAWIRAKPGAGGSAGSVFAAEAGGVGTSALLSPVITLPAERSQLSFQNSFNLEGPDPGTGFDAGVLEISIGHGPFVDILDAGGSFASGGYNCTISTDYDSPLGGRSGWSGNSEGFIATLVNLPAAAGGQPVQFQWRCATDHSTGGAGWRIDSVAIKSYWCCPGEAPPPPFVPAAGSYSGLFSPSNSTAVGASGAFTLTTTAGGTFTGSLQVGLSRYKLGGLFDPFGASDLLIPRVGNSPLAIHLQMDLSDNGQIAGTVSDGAWIAPLRANRNPFNARTNPAPYAGKYTLVIAGSGNPAETAIPLGDGYGALTVDAAGLGRFSGALADGTKLSGKATVGQTGQWPFHLALYKGQGLIQGWLAFTNTPQADLGGNVRWVKLPAAAARYYSAGFDLETSVQGSTYHAPLSPANSILTFTNGVVILTGGNLAADITNRVTIGAKSKVTDHTLTNRLTLTLSTSQGWFKGTALNPTTRKSVPFQGAILQKLDAGSGFFLGTNQAGKADFGAAP